MSRIDDLDPAFLASSGVGLTETGAKAIAATIVAEYEDQRNAKISECRKLTDDGVGLRSGMGQIMGQPPPQQSAPEGLIEQSIAEASRVVADSSGIEPAAMEEVGRWDAAIHEKHETAERAWRTLNWNRALTVVVLLVEAIICFAFWSSVFEDDYGNLTNAGLVKAIALSAVVTTFCIGYRTADTVLLSRMQMTGAAHLVKWVGAIAVLSIGVLLAYATMQSAPGVFEAMMPDSLLEEAAKMPLNLKQKLEVGAQGLWLLLGGLIPLAVLGVLYKLSVAAARLLNIIATRPDIKRWNSIHGRYQVVCQRLREIAAELDSMPSVECFVRDKLTIIVGQVESRMSKLILQLKIVDQKGGTVSIELKTAEAGLKATLAVDIDATVSAVVKTHHTSTAQTPTISLVPSP